MFSPIGRRGRRVGRHAGVNLLDLRPVREASWCETDEPLILTRSHPRERGRKGLRARIDHWLAMPRLKLDETGSFAWQRFDGRTTVREVAEAIRTEFGDEAEPVEQRLGSFVRLLHREGLVSYKGFDL